MKYRFIRDTFVSEVKTPFCEGDVVEFTADQAERWLRRGAVILASAIAPHTRAPDEGVADESTDGVRKPAAKVDSPTPQEADAVKEVPRGTPKPPTPARKR